MPTVFTRLEITVLKGPESPTPSPFVSTVAAVFWRFARALALTLLPGLPAAPAAAMREGLATTAALTVKAFTIPR